MDATKNHIKPLWLFIGVIIAGIAARLWAATRGHNYDMESWWILANILNHGGNVYAGTERYNYGPIWFNILHALDIIGRHNQTTLRYLIPGFLSLVDIGISYILWQKFGKLAASFFLLNPVTVIITGYHCQFDNLALLLGLVSVLLIGDDFEKPIGRRKFFGLLVLGLSLATKHVLFAFPFWLAVKQRGMLQKFTTILVPVVVFAAGFLPYWPGGKDGIIHHVFMYRSLNNEIFYHNMVPISAQILFSSQTIWLVLLLSFAFIYRKKNAFESLLFYTCVLVIASPAVVNQYFAITMPFVATNLNPFTLLYTAVASLHLIVNIDALHFHVLNYSDCRNIAICTLCMALIWVTWRQNIMALLGKVVFEVKHQLNLDR